MVDIAINLAQFRNPNGKAQNSPILLAPIHIEHRELITTGFNFTKGMCIGFCSEFISMLKFFVNAIVDPIGTVKGLIQGGATLIKLLTNPPELINSLKNAFHAFQNADAHEKGKIFGAILFNVSPVGSLQNMRILSSLRRIPVSVGAIVENWKLLQRYHRMNGGSWFNTMLAAKRVAAKANIKLDFQKALKMEGIPEHLAPKLRFTSKKGPPGGNKARGWYDVNKHEIVITTKALNWLPISDLIPGFSVGGLMRHEMKHAAQHILIAKAGLPSGLPLKIQLNISSDPKKYLSEAKKIYESAKNYPVYSKIVTSSVTSSNLWTRTGQIITRTWQIINYKFQYFLNWMEIEARLVQHTYQGIMPRIHSPSIHLLPYLAPSTENNNRNANQIASSNLSPNPNQASIQQRRNIHCTA